ncbi:MAG TPA: 50S ribosomal protein L29 [Polyangiaceae bacterium LLY-WYZ-15_(1-7)]|nr:50S ribosomal protein L29 [Sandaracinus sp.]HJK94319.1 50S ribosomal protein L29 [Polyangiaceae bacterium LLY-WYZ-15_(1-7)]MBJ74678.1 50S ribosomal protein L29 [Sandaracinus sp.]HJL00129.1 50S ribosomal protein L29 [Polyangiaceae bacterium LLY-WYZ-15_(1-7)]HJL08877.1 50S ribosomal protein L29 [Polyangiaceae bacterium LLY-WYZ-15_(1-7)]
MKPSEIREQTTEELEGLEQELQRKLWRARFDNHTNQLDDTSEIGRLRRDIARVKTILRERHAEASTEASTESAEA